PVSGVQLNHIVAQDELRPLFQTLVRRTTIELEPQSATRIEAAIDEGEIRGVENGRVEPVSEIELEVKSGDPAVAYDLGLRLLEFAPLRIEARSKADRGYRLIAAPDAAPSAVHAEPIVLNPSMTVETVLQTIGRRWIAHLLQNEAAVLVNNAEGVHQMRVATRRLRSALSAVRSMLPSEDYNRISGELKWLAAHFGSARSCDVFI